MPLLANGYHGFNWNDFYVVDGFDHYCMTMTVPTTVTPEPGTLLLLGTDLTGIGGVTRRRRQKNVES